MSYHDLNPVEHGVNWSALKVLLTHSPKHFYDQFIAGNKPDPSSAMIFGRLVHCAALEGWGQVRKEFAVKPTPPADKPTYYRTKDGRSEMKLWLSRNKGKDIVKQEEFDKVKSMIDALKQKDGSALWLFETEGTNEQAYQWDVQVPDFELPVLCRAKMDRIATHNGKRYVVDYKTTANTPTVSSFGRTVGEYMYHAQMAYYMDGVAADGAVLVAQETKAPYDSCVYVLDEELLKDGRRIYAEALRRYADCRLAHVFTEDATAWPGLPDSQLLGLESLGGWAGRDFA